MEQKCRFVPLVRCLTIREMRFQISIANVAYVQNLGH